MFKEKSAAIMIIFSILFLFQFSNVSFAEDYNPYSFNDVPLGADYSRILNVVKSRGYEYEIAANGLITIKNYPIGNDLVDVKTYKFNNKLLRIMFVATEKDSDKWVETFMRFQSLFEDRFGDSKECNSFPSEDVLHQEQTYCVWDDGVNTAKTRMRVVAPGHYEIVPELINLELFDEAVNSLFNNAKRMMEKQRNNEKNTAKEAF